MCACVCLCTCVRERESASARESHNASCKKHGPRGIPKINKREMLPVRPTPKAEFSDTMHKTYRSVENTLDHHAGEVKTRRTLNG